MCVKEMDKMKSGGRVRRGSRNGLIEFLADGFLPPQTDQRIV